MMPTISKISTASFALLLLRWRDFLRISVAPLVLMLPMLLTMMEILQLRLEDLAQIGLQDDGRWTNLPLYFLLFIYGFVVLSINIYRLVAIDISAASGFGLRTPWLRFLRFLGQSVLIMLLTVFPVLLTGFPILYPILYFLIIPLLLNLVSIAADKPREKLRLNFTTQWRIFVLQLILPMVISLPILLLGDHIFETALALFLRGVAFYFALVSLALCYRALVPGLNEKPLG